MPYILVAAFHLQQLRYERQHGDIEACTWCSGVLFIVKIHTEQFTCDLEEAMQTGELERWTRLHMALKISQASVSLHTGCRDCSMQGHNKEK